MSLQRSEVKCFCGNVLVQLRIAPNMVQSGPKMILKWSQSGPNGLKVVPKWSQVNDFLQKSMFSAKVNDFLQKSMIFCKSQ
jgi:hypothetical protein